MPTGHEFATAAMQYIGVPYKLGGNSRAGTDCSGHIVLALADVGIKGFPRHSADQIAACTPIPLAQAYDTPGAILWRPGHVSIVLPDRHALDATTTNGIIRSKITNTLNGAPRWTRAGLIPQLDYTTTKEGTPGMYNPVTGRVTSEYSPARRHPITGKVQQHAGIDIAAPTGTPIVAAFAGTVQKVGTAIVAGRTGLGILIKNPDGEQQYYGHLSKIGVKADQKVAAGEQIGLVGATGNVTGPHLHFETWNKYGTPVNPRLYFKYHKLTPGVAGHSTPATSSPSVTQSSNAVRAYQKRQNVAGAAGLVVDGIDGPKTKAWRAWVRLAQRSLNAFKSDRAKLVVDGDYGPVMRAYVENVQSRNRKTRLRPKGLIVDGILGNIMAAWMRSKGSKITNRP